VGNGNGDDLIPAFLEFARKAIVGAKLDTWIRPGSGLSRRSLLGLYRCRAQPDFGGDLEGARNAGFQCPGFTRVSGGAREQDEEDRGPACSAVIGDRKVHQPMPR
jgi:hypothetical protein